MGFLLKNDYIAYIQEKNLNQIIESDDEYLERCERRSIDTIKGYLRQRHDLTNAFINPVVWSPATSTYTTQSLVYLYAAPYVNTAAYTTNALAEYRGNVYICIQNGTDKIADSNYWTLIGAMYELFYGNTDSAHSLYDYRYLYKAGDKVFYSGKNYTAKSSHSKVKPDDPDQGALYWTDNGAYQISAGTLPTNSTKWVQGDNRNAELLGAAIDITVFHAHKRISPRNVPELRIIAYQDAMKWLSDASHGKTDPYLPIIEPREDQSGKRPRYGYKQKNTNTY